MEGLLPGHGIIPKVHEKAGYTSLSDDSGVRPNNATFSRRVRAAFSGPCQGTVVPFLSLGVSRTFC